MLLCAFLSKIFLALELSHAFILQLSFLYSCSCSTFNLYESEEMIFIRNHVVSSSFKCISLVHKKSVLQSLNILMLFLLQLLKIYNLLGKVVFSFLYIATSQTTLALQMDIILRYVLEARNTFTNLTWLMILLALCKWSCGYMNNSLNV